jgi:hypothetical protein
VQLANKLLNLLDSVYCNGEPAYVTSFLVGSGPAMPIYTSWSVSYSADDVDMKYYTQSDNEAKQLLVDSSENFAASSNGLSAQWRALMPDATLMPVIAYAIVPSTAPPLLLEDMFRENGLRNVKLKYFKFFDSFPRLPSTGVVQRDAGADL